MSVVWLKSGFFDGSVMYRTSISVQVNGSWVTANVHIKPMDTYHHIEIVFCGSVIVKQPVISSDLECAKMNALVLLSLKVEEHIRKHKDRIAYMQNELAEYEAFLEELHNEA